MLKRRLFWVLLLVVGVLVGAIVAGVFREREPEYGGKRLSEWVIMYGYGDSAQQADSSEALRHIGVNALPYLVNWMKYEQPEWKGNLFSRLDVTLERLGGTLHATDKQELLAEAASEILCALGPVSAPTCPELTRILHDPNAFVSRKRAIGVLLNIGEVGLRPLLTVMTDSASTDLDRFIVAKEIMTHGTNGRLVALRTLRDFLTGPDADLRTAATNALAYLDPQALGQGSRRSEETGFMRGAANR